VSYRIEVPKGFYTMFDTLFSTFDIGSVRLANRIVSTGHDTTLPTDGTVNDALVAYHEARAEGGVGLIVCQVTGVHETARYTNHVLMATDDSCIAGFQRLAEAVHKHGAKLIVQLFHPGREMTESLDGSAPVAYAPSVSPSERYHVIPRAMPLAMIQDVIAGYGAAAERLERAGVDGVEIVASHGYLPAQFLSEIVNRRTDSYGGAFENRLRFLKEAINAAKATTSDDFVVGLRVSGDEKYDEGSGEDLSLQVIRALEIRLDYVSVVAGTSATLGGAVHIVPPMYEQNGYLAPFAARVKTSTGLPVIVTGRINQPQDAEAIIATNQADLCGMTRALICDPKMPQKARNGLPDDIRACIGCNQACIGHFHRGHPISCIQHPETGRELHYNELKPTDNPMQVMVIGGGPAGMKAAAVAAARGHVVTLYETGNQLGGQARLAQLLPNRAEFGGIITNLTREMEMAGVTVKTNSHMTPETIASQSPDAIVIATGGTPRWPAVFEHDVSAQVVDATAILRNEVNVGASVVVADWSCNWVGSGVAEHLAQQGCRVRLAVNGLTAGEALQSYVRDSNAARLHALGVEIIPYARLYGQDENTVYLQHTVSGDPIILDDVQTLVLAQGSVPNDNLVEPLAGFDGPVLQIGDCQMPRTCEEAVLEGLIAGNRL
jgi:2,4-dienoyl-CoA reductase-like NADH-dependent reductase (Old Yellow Enzyme family)